MVLDLWFGIHMVSQGASCLLELFNLTSCFITSPITIIMAIIIPVYSLFVYNLSFWLLKSNLRVEFTVKYEVQFYRVSENLM